MDPHNIADIYPLSPMQRGMLFHSLYAPESGVYVEQYSFVLEGQLDPPAMRSAWRSLVDRHDVLRTAFVWQDLDEPLQVVHKQVDLPVLEEDWRNKSPEDQTAHLDEFLRDDARRGFDQTQAPLMRLALLRIASDQYHVVWTHHHLLFDGWCMPLLLQELFGFYEALARGASFQPGSVRPFRDYIAWLQQRDQDQAEQYWRTTLAGLDHPTTMDVRLEPAKSSGSLESKVRLSEPVTAKLEKLARDHQLTLSTVVQGAWAILLHRYCRSNDVMFGATVSGRPTDLPGSQEMVGLFINTLPVRVQIRADLSVTDWLKRLQMRQAESREYEYTPLTDIKGWSDLPNEVPLFDHILVFENYPLETSAKKTSQQALRFQSLRSFAKTNYPLTIVAAPGKRLTLRALHDGQQWNAGAAERLLGHLEVVLDAFATQPDQPLSELPLLSSDEEEQIACLSHGKQIPIDEASVHQHFEQLAISQPDALALTFDQEHVTYRCLNEQANRLARALRARNVGAESIVGICLDRSIDMLVSMLAVLKSGGAFLPLDPSYPQDRITYMVKDSGVQLVLTNAAALNRVADCAGEVFCVDRPGSKQDGEPANLNLNISSQNLAYVIYTSGSSGQPKGTMLHHRGLLNLARTQQEAFGVTNGDRVLQFAAMSFDASVWEMVMALLSGATLVLADRDHLAGQPLQDTLHHEQVSIVTLPPSVLAVLPSHNLPSLRTIVTAGEACTPELVNRWSTNRVYVNAYGPTETTVCASMYRCHANSSTSPPMGRANPNFDLHVLDDQLRRVPNGVAGELCVAGMGLLRGYLHRPELTADRVVPNPFGGPATSRLYRTGDLVRTLEDGNLEYLGRIDQQVKVRGFRIELGEIEAAIARFEEVKDVAVIAKKRQVEDGREDRQLVAFVVSRAPTPVDVSGLIGFLQERIPDYMIPMPIVEVDALPLTPSGKVDRKALLAVQRDGEADTVLPINATEELLAGMISNVLGVKNVGREDNFFELGGHSLLATRLVSKIQDAFQVDVPLRTVFDHPQLCRLATQIDELRKGPEVARSAIPRVPRTDRLPLSFGQQRLWFVDQLVGQSGSYNVPIAVRLKGDVDVGGLTHALNAIVARHEVLRTRFVSVQGQPVQEIADHQEIELDVVDVGSPSNSESENLTEAARLVQEFVHRPFDLSAAPLLRGAVVKMGPGDHVMLVVMHHIVSDGWSMGVIMEEFAALYHAFMHGEPDTLPPLTLQYADFAAWQRSHLSGDVLSRQLDYWKGALENLPPHLDLPLDHPRPPVQSFRGADHSVHISSDVSERLIELSRKSNATPFMTLLSAFQLLLYRYSGQSDIVVGSPVANRGRSETQRMIGFFVNTIALRSDFSDSPSFHELLRRVRERTLDAYAHQDLPFEQLVDAIAPDRDTRVSPIFQVVFSLQRAGKSRQDVSGMIMERFEFGSAISKFDLTLFMTETPDGFTATFEYNTDLFQTDTIEGLACQFQTLLQSIIDEPDLSVDELTLLSDEQSQTLLAIGADTKTNYPRTEMIHGLFRAVATKTPDAIAITYDDQQLTYGELNRRSDQLAAFLQSKGVGPEKLVALCVERSVELPVYILGILKAGGAYLALEPSYPTERLNYILRDSQAEILLTLDSLTPDLETDLVQIVAVDAQWGALSQPASHTPVAAFANGIADLDADNLAYVIYTSGSTGHPKGTAVTHRNVVRLVQNTNFAELSPDEVWLQFAPVSFDASTLELWGCLLHGARMAVAPSGKASLNDLANTIEEQEVTSLWLTAGLFNLMVEQKVASLRNVRQLLAGGDVLSTNHVRQFIESCPQAALINGYGPTENTTFTCCHRITGSNDNGISVPIGRPISNTQVYVLDAQQHPVPIGAPGELFTGGDGVARGYFRRPDLTAEKFVPALTNQPGDRSYRTGDIVRWRADHNLMFLGRRDHQVKIRGFRIELGEIEAVTLAHPAIRETVTIAYDEPTADKSLVTYYVVREEDTLSVNEIRGYLNDRLPHYMVPAYLVELDNLPLTPNGKVDRSSLPSPTESTLSRNEYVAPSTATEKLLASIFSEVLPNQPIGIHDNFFELGGDSIKSLRVVALAENAGLGFSVTEFFQNPRVGSLAQVARPTAPAARSRDNVTGNVELTPIQHWFFQDCPPNPHHWNWSLLYEVADQIQLTPKILAEATRDVYLHHDALRLRFEHDGQDWRQRYADREVTLPVSVIDLTQVPSRQVSKTVGDVAAATQSSLNLEAGPLFRMIYFRCGNDVADRLLIILHHLVVDGVSARILLEDFLTAARYRLKQAAVQLPAKTASYQDWSRQLVDYSQSVDARNEVAYWAEVGELADDVAPLPLDFADGINDEFSATRVVSSLSTEETKLLLSGIPKKIQATPQNVLLTALVETIGNWTGRRKCHFETEGHGREDLFPGIHVARTVGWFTSMYPCVLDIQDANDPQEAIQLVGEQHQSIPRRGTGYGVLRYLSRDEDVQRVMQQIPQAQLNFNYLGQFEGQGATDEQLLRPAKERTGAVRDLSGRRAFPLYVLAFVEQSRLHVHWSYSRSLHREETIQQRSDDFMATLRGMLSLASLGKTPESVSRGNDATNVREPSTL